MSNYDNSNDGFLSTTGGKITVGVLLGGGLLIVLLFMGIMSAKRDVISLGEAVEAQGTVVAQVQDKMWKVLAQKANVSSQVSIDKQKEMLAEVVEGRKGGQFAKYVQEQNPQANTKLLENLMLSVDTERTAVLRANKKWIDLNRQRNIKLQDPFWGQFLTAYQKIEIKPITSAKTKTAVETGEDNDVDLFPGASKK